MLLCGSPMKTLILVAAITLAAVASVKADPLTFTDNNPADVYLVVVAHPTYNGSFDLKPAGFVPGSMTVTSAYVVFTFWDLPLLGGSEAGNVRWDLNNSLFGSFTSFSGEFTISGSLISGSLLGQLNANGVLDYTVIVTRGETWLTNANLTATVPERTTTALLVGLGAVAVAAVSRRQLKRVQP
jgi:hypothetical protein